MSDGPWLTTPVAIVIGSVVIATGAYLGLRERAEAPSPIATHAASAAAPTASASASVTAAPADGAVTASATKEEAMRRALAFLAERRSGLVESCWRPSIAKSPEPARVGLTLDLTVSSTGTQIARGIVEERGAARADVTSCVQEKLPPFELGDVGAPQHLEVPLAFP